MHLFLIQLSLTQRSIAEARVSLSAMLLSFG